MFWHFRSSRVYNVGVDYNWTDIPGIDFGLFHHCHFFCFFWLCTVSENKYSLICSTFTGTLNQLHFILLFIFHFIFQFLHVVLMEYACLLDPMNVKRLNENLTITWNITDTRWRTLVVVPRCLARWLQWLGSVGWSPSTSISIYLAKIYLGSAHRAYGQSWLDYLINIFSRLKRGTDYQGNLVQQLSTGADPGIFDGGPSLHTIPSPLSGGPGVHPRNNFEILLRCRWILAYFFKQKVWCPVKGFRREKVFKLFWQVYSRPPICYFYHYNITTDDAP